MYKVFLFSLFLTQSLYSLQNTQYGEVSGEIKLMHIIHDKTNDFTPKDGSGYLIGLKYKSPDLGIKGLKAKASYYINGDTGLTNWNDNNKDALGMFSDKEGKTKAIAGEFYMEFKNSEAGVRIGRQVLHSPLTKIRESLMPNFYQAALVKSKKYKGTSFTAFHINKMSYGSRSATDYGVIGEKTGTAGATTAVFGQGSGTREQARFLNLGEAAGLGAKTRGMSVIGITYKPKKHYQISVWDYLTHNISNTLYFNTDYIRRLTPHTNIKFSAQYLKQKAHGNKLAGDIDFSMYGFKVKAGNKKRSFYLAYNASNESEASFSGFYNPFGADPAYTSSIFSRNAYREDVSAYKIGAEFIVLKDVKVSISHANYSKSKTSGWDGKVASSDATETDIVVSYKPNKETLLKVFNAQRTSEYHNASDNVERKQNHVRATASYNF
jgi:hypothetical protein